MTNWLGISEYRQVQIDKHKQELYAGIKTAVLLPKSTGYKCPYCGRKFLSIKYQAKGRPYGNSISRANRAVRVHLQKCPRRPTCDS